MWKVFESLRPDQSNPQVDPASSSPVIPSPSLFEQFCVGLEPGVHHFLLDPHRSSY